MLAEALLWEEVRNNKFLGLKFRRQHPVGRYIADFYCDKERLVIELDGKIHELQEVKEYDMIRQKEIENRRIKVLRIKNEEIFNDLAGVLKKIEKILK